MWLALCNYLPLPPPELSDTGRMLSTALSDGYLTMHDESQAHTDLSPHHHQLSMSLDGRFSTLFPPLSQNDRHPSAPQLVSMLTDNKADVMLHEDQVCTVVINTCRIYMYNVGINYYTFVRVQFICVYIHFVI